VYNDNKLQAAALYSTRGSIQYSNIYISNVKHITKCNVIYYYMLGSRSGTRINKSREATHSTPHFFGSNGSRIFRSNSCRRWPPPPPSSSFALRDRSFSGSCVADDERRTNEGPPCEPFSCDREPAYVLKYEREREIEETVHAVLASYLSSHRIHHLASLLDRSPEPFPRRLRRR